MQQRPAEAQCYWSRNPGEGCDEIWGLMDPADSSMVPAEGMDLGVVLVLTFHL